MREKDEQIVLTFQCTTDAISAEKVCAENGSEGRLIPVPRVLSASCGMAWKAPLSEEENLENLIAKNLIRTEGKYHLFL